MRIIPTLGILLSATFALAADEPSRAPAGLAEALLLHASFDDSPNAEVASGDSSIYTATSLKRDKVRAGLHSPGVRLDPRSGRYGGALAFTKKVEEIIYFTGKDNLPSTDGPFSGSILFWMRLSPATDLPPGYVDPIQITDKNWNDASLFVDFTKDLPRKFRLGVFSDYQFWNPQDREWDAIPPQERPLVTVDEPPFSRDRWTHVAITLRDMNAEQKSGLATLYLDGKPQGSLRGKQQITWGDDRLAIMLGIYYVGRLDDLAVFNKALSEQEIQRILQLPSGIGSLMAKRP